MPFQDPAGFDWSVFMVERVNEAYSELTCYPLPLTSVTIDFRAMQGPILHSRTNSGSGGSNSRGNNKHAYYY